MSIGVVPRETRPPLGGWSASAVRGGRAHAAPALTRRFIAEQPAALADTIRPPSGLESADHAGTCWTLLRLRDSADPVELMSISTWQFADYAANAVRRLCATMPPQALSPVISVFDEPSAPLRAMIQHAGKAALDPSLSEERQALRRHLIELIIAASQAVRATAPTAQIMHGDTPLHWVAPLDAAPAAHWHTARLSCERYLFWDTIIGAAEPQLGGHPRLLDWVGVSEHFANQFELSSGGTPIALALDDPRRESLTDLLTDLSDRYARPLCLGESDPAGCAPQAWHERVTGELAAIRAIGLTVHRIEQSEPGDALGTRLA